MRRARKQIPCSKATVFKTKRSLANKLKRKADSVPTDLLRTTALADVSDLREMKIATARFIAEMVKRGYRIYAPGGKLDIEDRFRAGGDLGGYRDIALKFSREDDPIIREVQILQPEMWKAKNGQVHHWYDQNKDFGIMLSERAFTAEEQNVISLQIGKRLNWTRYECTRAFRKDNRQSGLKSGANRLTSARDSASASSISSEDIGSPSLSVADLPSELATILRPLSENAENSLASIPWDSSFLSSSALSSTDRAASFFGASAGFITDTIPADQAPDNGKAITQANIADFANSFKIRRETMPESAMWRVFDRSAFEADPNSRLVRVNELISRKDQREDPKFMAGKKQFPLANAYRFMLGAEQRREGSMRRAPIEVSRNADGTYEVLDGNATAQVLMLAGWRYVPTSVKSETQSAGTLDQILEREGGTIEAQLSPASRTAFHGTPHSFDRFTLEKVGTGEGAQAYGWGLYFAENPKVAEEYRKKLSGDYKVDGKPLRITATPRSLAESEVIYAMAAGESAAQAVVTAKAKLRERLVTTRTALETVRGMVGKRSPGWGNLVATDATVIHEREKVKLMEEAVQESEGLNPESFKKEAGNTYTVDLDVEPEELADWDKGFSEQPEKVRAALGEMTVGKERDADVLWSVKLGEDYVGGFMTKREAQAFADNGSLSQIYRYLAGSKGPGNVSREWARKGIAGVQYLDQGSRVSDATVARAREIVEELRRQYQRDFNENTRLNYQDQKAYVAELEKKQREGTYNYVIFDEGKIQITHRNGDPIEQTPMARAPRFDPNQIDIFGGNTLTAPPAPSKGAATNENKPAKPRRNNDPLGIGNGELLLPGLHSDSQGSGAPAGVDPEQFDLFAGGNATARPGRPGSGGAGGDVIGGGSAGDGTLGATEAGAAGSDREGVSGDVRDNGNAAGEPAKLERPPEGSPDRNARPPHSPTPVPVLTVSGAAGAKANSLQSLHGDRRRASPAGIRAPHSGTQPRQPGHLHRFSRQAKTS